MQQLLVLRQVQVIVWIQGTSSTVNGVVFSGGYASPELDRDSGEIIYVENRRAISRASDQTEDIKVVVEY